MRQLNQKGSVLIFLTLGFALLSTFVGFALDFGRGYLEKARISRLIDAAALAAAKALKGQSGLETQATRAACDSMTMNGAAVVFTGGNTCIEKAGAPLKVLVEYFDVPVNGGPPMRHVRVTGTKAVQTTFLNFLGWMVPGDYSTLNVAARAEAGPERPVDLMLVLDRSGSMNQSGKLAAMVNTVNEFLSNNFTGDDRVGMVSFASRGCGTSSGRDSTVNNVCTPDVSLTAATSGNITSLKNKISALVADGGTNTMEALRTARAPLAAAFNDTTRATTRKAILLVTDGQPTFLSRANDAECKQDPKERRPLSGVPAGTYASGCKHGVTTDGRGLFQPLGSGGTTGLSVVTASGINLYQNIISCARSMTGYCQGTDGAMHEANLIRDCGYNNSACTSGGAHDVLVFAIGIGRVEPTQPQASFDKNAKCLLARIANASDVLNTGNSTIESLNTVCTNPITTADGDTHDDLTRGWRCGAGPCVDTSQEKGKVYIVDQNGNIQAQLQQVFNEIAAILKLRLTL